MGKYINYYILVGLVSFGRRLIYTAALLVVGLLVGSSFGQFPVHAAPGVNQQMNYQARLLGSTGAVVPDGTYNLEFKIYQDGNGCIVGGTSPCGGTLKWTETRTGANKVTVTNGYFSVQLGEVTAFAGNVDWNQDTLWLSINVGGTGTPSWDGEMTPFRRLAASPYALNAGQLGGRLATGFFQLAPTAVQTDSSTLSSLFVNKTGASGNILQLQKGGADVLTLNNNGTLALADLQSAASQALTITANAASTWSTSAGSLSVQGAAGLNLLGGSSNVAIGTADTTGTLLVLDTKTNAGDPAGVNGGLYYNASTGKFRCYQGGAWTDCIGSGGATCTVGGTFICQSGNTFGAAVTIGTNDNFGVNFKINNAMVMNIQTDGSVGIGTTPDADAQLHVRNDGAFDTRITIENAHASGSPQLSITTDSTEWLLGSAGSTDADAGDFYVYDTNGGGYKFRIEDDADVGIGTIASGTANAAVHLDRGNAAASAVKWTAGTLTGQAATDGFDIGITSAGEALINQRENLKLSFNTNNTTRMSISAAGDVGIGTVDPVNALHIDQGTTGATAQITTGATSGTSANDGLQLTIDSSNNGYLTNQENSPLHLGTNGQTRMTIGAAGDITVGTADTTGSLLVLDTKNNAGDPTGSNGGMYYNSNMGKFRCYENGAWKQCGSTTLRVSADVLSTDAVNWANVTGLTANVNAGETYTFRCMLTYTTAISTTAINLSTNGPTATALDYGIFVATTATTIHSSSQNAYNTVTNPATGGGTTRLTAEMSGTFIPAVAGTFAIRLKSEVAASAVTVKRGSFCVIE